MKPSLKSYLAISTEPVGPEKWHPDDEDCFGIYIDMNIGPTNSNTSNIFQNMLVCTPKWFADNMPSDGIQWGYGILFVREYNFIQIKRFIEKHLESLNAPTWEELALKISRIGHWEFENYQEYK